MKKLITVLACACALFIAEARMISFGFAGYSKPDAVALDFMKTMQAGKADEAYLRANCTEETAKLFGALMAMAKDELMKEMAGATFKVTDTKIDGKNAVVTIKVKGLKKGNEEAKINLKKVNGKWKIHQTKEEQKAEDKPKEAKAAPAAATNAPAANTQMPEYYQK